MKLLIATKNLDKYKIVTNLLLRCNSNLKFYNLRDLNIDSNIKEVGTIADRAKQKALFYQKYLKQNSMIDNIDWVIGVDDGIGFSKKDEGNPNSKELTDKILSNQCVNTGDKVWIKRAYSVIGKNNQIMVCTTSIPFIFFGNRTSVKRQDNKYPLSRVFGVIDDNARLTIAEMDFNDSLDYYFKFSEKELCRLAKFMTE